MWPKNEGSDVTGTSLCIAYDRGGRSKIRGVWPVWWGAKNNEGPRGRYVTGTSGVG